MKLISSLFSTVRTSCKSLVNLIPNPWRKKNVNQMNLDLEKGSSYMDPTLTTEEKLDAEKRRRYQAYMTLDYLISAMTYFDFFSVDAFEIAKKSKSLARLFEKRVVTSDLLLLPFFTQNLEIVKLLHNYEVREKKVVPTIYGLYNRKRSFVKIVVKFLKSLVAPIEGRSDAKKSARTKDIKYSYEVNQLFEKASQNAMNRFKTPVISSEILLITMLEERTSKVGELLTTFTVTDTNWYMLRYSLMKRLHTQELAIRTQLPKNYQFFAYLLKTQLTEREFDIMMEKNIMTPSVLLFRNSLIAEVMRTGLSAQLQKDIRNSIRSRRHERKYSQDIDLPPTS